MFGSTAPAKHAGKMGTVPVPILTCKGESTLKIVSLKENRLFRRLYAKGKTAASPYLAVYCRRNGTKGNRLGITVSTKLGNAVKRNRVRRRLREVYRLNEHRLRMGYDIVIVARYRSVRARYSDLDKSFLVLAKKLGLLLGGEKEES